jgi:hypothetical protein
MTATFQTLLLLLAVLVVGNRALTSDRIRTRNRLFPDRKYAYFGSDGERGKGGA